MIGWRPKLKLISYFSPNSTSKRRPGRRTDPGVRPRLARLVALGLLGLAIRGTGAAEAVPDIGFTAAQADRGYSLYAANCSRCHGETLQGGAGTPLIGTPFQSHWAGRTLRQLMQVLATQMPPSAPGSLSDAEQFDLIAFLLRQNHYPAGTAPLDAAEAFTPLFESLPSLSEETSAPLGTLPGQPMVYAQAASGGPDEAELRRNDDAQWLMYNKGYQGHRYSGLTQINVHNASRLHAICAFQLGQTGWFQASPVIYQGRLYVTAGNSTYAIDAATCRKLWQFDFVAAERAPLLFVNRGIALYHGAVYRSTPAGHLIALDALSGKLLWDVKVCDTRDGRWLAAAPLVFDDKVFIGEAGGDAGADSHVYAFDATNGSRLWTFDLVPTGSQAGAASWQQGAATGGGSTWSSYAVDPQSQTLCVPVGNPAPAYAGDARPGDNLFSNSVVALDTGTGVLRWHVQQLPHDVHDWDTAAPPVLYSVGGRSYIAEATKGGWLYLYDAATHALLAQSEVSSHLNADRPPTAEGVRACPGNLGGVQWYGPAFAPNTQALFVNSVEWCGKYTRLDPQYSPGLLYLGGQLVLDPDVDAYGWIRSFSAINGQQRWARKMPTPMLAALTATAGKVLMTGDLNGQFMVLNAADGRTLYQFNTGGAIAGGVSTYRVGREQYVAVASGNSSRITWGTSGSATVFVFGLH